MSRRDEIARWESWGTQSNTTSSSAHAVELHDHRADEGEWEEERDDVVVRPRRTEVVSFRLQSDELDRLLEAARRSRQSLSEFIRAALLDKESDV